MHTLLNTVFLTYGQARPSGRFRWHVMLYIQRGFTLKADFIISPISIHCTGHKEREFKKYLRNTICCLSCAVRLILFEYLNVKRRNEKSSTDREKEAHITLLSKYSKFGCPSV